MVYSIVEKVYPLETLKCRIPQSSILGSLFFSSFCYLCTICSNVTQLDNVWRWYQPILFTQEYKQIKQLFETAYSKLGNVNDSSFTNMLSSNTNKKSIYSFIKKNNKKNTSSITASCYW